MIETRFIHKATCDWKGCDKSYEFETVLLSVSTIKDFPQSWRAEIVNGKHEDGEDFQRIYYFCSADHHGEWFDEWEEEQVKIEDAAMDVPGVWDKDMQRSMSADVMRRGPTMTDD